MKTSTVIQNILSLSLVIASWYLVENWSDEPSLLDLYVPVFFAGCLWRSKAVGLTVVPSLITSFVISALYESTTPTDPQKAIGYIFTMPTGIAYFIGAFIRNVLQNIDEEGVVDQKETEPQ